MPGLDNEAVMCFTYSGFLMRYLQRRSATFLMQSKLLAVISVEITNQEDCKLPPHTGSRL